MQYESPESAEDHQEVPVSPESFERQFELEIVPDLQQLADMAENLEQTVEGREEELSPSLKTRLESARESLSKIAFRSFMLGTFAWLGLSIAQYNKPNPEESESKASPAMAVAKEISSDGHNHFQHSDKTTTHILNYLSGKDTLSEPEVLELMRKDWAGDVDSTAVLPENTNVEVLVDSVAKHYKKKGHNTNDNLRTFFLDEYTNFPRFLEFNEDIYKALWQIEEEVGSPKVGFMDPKIDGERLGTYYPKDNRVVISMTNLSRYRQGDKLSEYVEFDEDMGVLLGEYAHAKQFFEKPGVSTKQNYVDRSQTVARADSLKITLDSAQQYEYSIPGSIEYEAHKILQPQLIKRFKKLAKVTENSPIKKSP